MSSTKTTLKNVVAQLQAGNRRRDDLERQLKDLKKAHESLQRDYQTLKYGLLCPACQLRLSSTQGGCVEDPCPTCQDLGVHWQARHAEQRKRAIYWQRCYESLLDIHYGQGNVDGAHE